MKCLLSFYWDKFTSLSLVFQTISNTNTTMWWLVFSCNLGTVFFIVMAKNTHIVIIHLDYLEWKHATLLSVKSCLCRKKEKKNPPTMHQQRLFQPTVTSSSLIGRWFCFVYRYLVRGTCVRRIRLASITSCVFPIGCLVWSALSVYEFFSRLQ